MYFGTNAKVTDNAKVTGDAWVTDNALVTDNAKVTGHAKVTDNARVTGDAKVTDNAMVTGRALVTGDAMVTGHALIYGVMRSDGYCFTYLPTTTGEWRVIAGCRYFTMPEARDHWGSENYRDQKLGKETMVILDCLEMLRAVKPYGV